jgi:hypothetical protein
MVYKTKIRVFTTLIFAVSLMTFGIILGAPMRQWAFASTIHASLSSELNLSVSQAPPVCEESGQGSNFSFCLDAAGPNVRLSQSNQATASDNSNIDIQGHARSDIAIRQEVQCNESGPGDNNAVCQAFAFDDSFTFATNKATASGNSNIEQDSDAEFLQSQDQQLQCDESGAGDNNAVCQNTSIDTGSVFQANTATSSGNANIEQGNKANVAQTIEQQIKCGESGAGDNNAVCQNQATNNIDSLSQTNTATAFDNGNIKQGNNADVVQRIAQQNTCGESGAGDNNAVCQNDAGNFIGSITQTNDANGDGNFDHNNDLKILQAAAQQNKCGDFGFGTNNNCENTATSTVGPVSQTNGQSLDINQNTDQNNHCNIDSTCSNTATEDVEGINSGTVSQDVTQDNNCLFESSCSNTASPTVPADGTNNGNANANQKIDQSNLCMFNSNCLNDASATDSTSNTQSNMCFFDSNCENTGVNDNTLCIAGSNCSNSGTDSRLIGVSADDCSSSGTGTTVCVGSLRVHGSGGVSDLGTASSHSTTSMTRPVATSVTPITTTIPTTTDSSATSQSPINTVQQNTPTTTPDSVSEVQDAQSAPLSGTTITDNVNTNNDDAKLTIVDASSSDAANQDLTSANNDVSTTTKAGGATNSDADSGNNNQQLVTISSNTKTSEDGGNNAATGTSVSNADGSGDGDRNDNTDATKADSKSAAINLDDKNGNSNSVTKDDADGGSNRLHTESTKKDGSSNISEAKVDHGTTKKGDDTGNSSDNENKKKESNTTKEHNKDAKIHHDKKHASEKEHAESTKKEGSSNS